MDNQTGELELFGISFRFRFNFWLCKFGEALVELIDTASSVNKLHFTGKEWVRCSRNFKLYERVVVAVFPFNGVLGLCAGVGNPRLIAGEILEDNFPEIFWMDITFHVRFISILNLAGKDSYFSFLEKFRW